MIFEEIESKLCFMQKGGAGLIRKKDSNTLVEELKSMLLYSPVYDEYTMLSQYVQSDLVEDFYSDKLDTLNYILYGGHLKTMHTFKAGVIHALKVEYWGEYSCDYIVLLNSICK